MANDKRMLPVTMEDVRIAFRNFEGKEGQYNRKGDRNFAVMIDDSSLAQHMLEDGWNVKQLRARDEDEAPQDYIQVSVKYDGPRPPKIVMVGSKNKTRLEEEDVKMLDWAEIESVDLILNPYSWDVNGKTGVKAYAKSVYVKIREDELELKYLDVPDSSQNIPDMDDRYDED